jgi:hypothetical protein
MVRGSNADPSSRCLAGNAVSNSAGVYGCLCCVLYIKDKGIS